MASKSEARNTGESRKTKKPSREYLLATLDAMPDLIFELDAEGRHWDYRAMRRELLTVPAAQLIGQTVHQIMPQAAANAVMKALAEASQKGHSQGTQILLPLPVGDTWFELSVARKSPVTKEGPRFIVISRDISERKRAEAAVEQLAYTDGLTGVPNRRMLLDKLEQALHSSHETGKQGALLFIDLDDFKIVNDTKGHTEGDRLLQQVAERLRACVRAGDTVARLGGDEFAVILEGLDAQTESASLQATKVTEKVLASLAGKSNPPVQNEHHVTASIGLCLFQGKTKEAAQLLQHSDAAMYAAKKKGRNNFVEYSSSLHTAGVATNQMADELKEALNHGQLELRCQPKVDSAGAIVGAEVQVYWNHPAQGPLAPHQFLPTAEANGLCVSIGEWTVEQSFGQLKHWQETLGRAVPLSIPLSLRCFRRIEFVERLLGAARHTGVDLSQVTLEFNESVALNSAHSVIEKMNTLKAHQLRLSLRDFGTGFSSLSFLTCLPLDEIKIDASFVRGMSANRKNAMIVQTIIHMASDLGLTVIADGVDNASDRLKLIDSGCSLLQGDFVGPALPFDQFEKWAIMPQRPHARPMWGEIKTKGL
jgi:diguanylate cyclase (GGDEF)-like protein/PAS domain S-box-containing protein